MRRRLDPPGITARSCCSFNFLAIRPSLTQLGHERPTSLRSTVSKYRVRKICYALPVILDRARDHERREFICARQRRCSRIHRSAAGAAQPGLASRHASCGTGSSVTWLHSLPQKARRIRLRRGSEYRLRVSVVPKVLHCSKYTSFDHLVSAAVSVAGTGPDQIKRHTATAWCFSFGAAPGAASFGGLGFHGVRHR
jgi:hypothetical protein